MTSVKSIACVTGASGIVGRRIVDLLLEQGYSVRVLSRQTAFPDSRVELFCGDIGERALLESFVAGANLMFHCAAEIRDESKMWDVNVTGTRNLVAAVEKSPVHYFCFISSAGVVGKSKLHRIDEDIHCQPQTLYERTKLEAEKTIKSRLNGCRSVILRPANVTDKERLGLIQPLLIHPILSQLYVFIKGSESAHLIHAVDVAEVAVYFISQAPAGETELFFISRDDEPLNTFAGIWWTLSVITGQNSILQKLSGLHLPPILLKIIRILFLRSDVQPDMRISNQKLLTAGFRFSTTFEETLRMISESGQTSISGKGTKSVQIRSGGIWAIMGKILGSVFNLAINAILARLLSVEEMGGFFIVLSIVMFSSVFAQFGLNYAVIRVVAESMALGMGQRVVQALTKIFKIAGCGILSVSFLLALKGGYWISVYIFESPLVAQAVGMMSIWVIVFALQHLIGETFRGLADIRFASIFGAIMPSLLVFFLTGGVLLGYGRCTLNQVIGLFVLAGMVNILIGFFFLWRQCSGIETRRPSTPITFNALLHLAWPMWLTNLLLFIIAQSDLWVVGIFTNPEDVAAYGAASRLAILISAPLLIVNAVVPPHVAELYALKKTNDLETILRVVASFSGVIGFLIFTVLVFFSEDALYIIYGPDYLKGGTILVLLSVGHFFQVWCGACAIVLMMTGQQVTMMMITCCCGTLALFMGILLVGPYGTIGVAIGTATGMVTQNICMIIAVKKKVKIWTPMYSPIKLFKRTLSKAR